MLGNIKKNIIENRKYEALVVKKDSKRKPRVSLLEKLSMVGEAGDGKGDGREREEMMGEVKFGGR